MNTINELTKNDENIKEMYPAGTRIRLIHMSDPYSPVEDGMRGTVKCVDDIGTLHMRWDNGRSLGLIPEEDDFVVIDDEKQ